MAQGVSKRACHCCLDSGTASLKESLLCSMDVFLGSQHPTLNCFYLISSTKMQEVWTTPLSISMESSKGQNNAIKKATVSKK